MRGDAATAAQSRERHVCPARVVQTAFGGTMWTVSVEEYADLPLGGVDAPVVALAQRLELRNIAALDRRALGSRAAPAHRGLHPAPLEVNEHTAGAADHRRPPAAGLLEAQLPGSPASCSQIRVCRHGLPPLWSRGGSGSALRVLGKRSALCRRSG